MGDFVKQPMRSLAISICILALTACAAAAQQPAVPQAGDVFRDCAVCPEMTVVPAGTFVMGSPDSEAGRFAHEQPQHTVTLERAFAVGRFEVTFAEWDACLAAGGCLGHKPKDKDWGRGNRPVMNVSWKQARAFTDWLRQSTGKPYRLLTEAEWEYAARAGTTTARFWGNASKDACRFANVHDRTSLSVNGYDWPHHNCYDGYAQTAPVGRFEANAFGLYDMLGNVWEWTEDCWHARYDGAPDSGAAWTAGGRCDLRVSRGGGWDVVPRGVRSANRDAASMATRDDDIGFRVARSLD
jgi:formylglycine-generating enzyme required for sulfatase activity